MHTHLRMCAHVGCVRHIPYGILITLNHISLCAALLVRWWVSDRFHPGMNEERLETNPIGVSVILAAAATFSVHFNCNNCDHPIISNIL